MDFSSCLLLRPRALSMHPRLNGPQHEERKRSRARAIRILSDLFFTFDAFLNPREG
jgi:hypothetical protein